MKILERILLILCVLICLTGCHQQQIVESAENVPTTNHLEAETESNKLGQLDVVPWNSNRCEETSNFTIAETESGWYLLHASWLYYADKSNPSNWILLCNKPDCEHYDQCNALITTTGFLVSKNSIWHTASKMELPQYADSFSSDIVIVQTDLNGSNKRIALDVKDASLSSSGGQAHYFMGDSWVYIVSELNPDGTANTRGIRISSSGSDTFFSRTDADIKAQISGARNQFVIYGDKYFSVPHWMKQAAEYIVLKTTL